VRETGLGVTAFVPGEPDAWEGWEDSAVAPERLGGYLRDLRRLMRAYRYDSPFYGHFGDGCVHLRINFDLRTAGGVRTWRRFLDEAADLDCRTDFGRRPTPAAFGGDGSAGLASRSSAQQITPKSSCRSRSSPWRSGSSP
jgi:hypothetical protein